VDDDRQTVADAVGAALAGLGVRDVFGVVGSGNLVVSNALCAGGASFHAARHEGGAVCMADGYARVSGSVGVASVHQGPGLTNAVTALAEAAKSATPLLVLAGDTPAADLTSNFRVDQHDLVQSVGALVERVHSAQTAVDDATRALRRAAAQRRPVVLMLPIDVQLRPATPSGAPAAGAPACPPAPAVAGVEEAASLLAASQRPVLLAGRGAVLADAGPAIERLGRRAGALLATTAPAKGLFAGNPYAIGISGGFSSPTATELLASADLVVAFGAGLNHWTTRSGRLLGTGPVVRIDVRADALERGPRPRLGIVADAAATAIALERALERRGHETQGWRTADTAEQIATSRWRDEPIEPVSADGVVNPRALSVALDDLLPAQRTVAVDSGHFLGWPAMYLEVPDARAWVFPNGFQCVGLGLGCAIGAAVAQPDRITVAAVGDGGLFMALPELETAARLGLRLLIVVYDDHGYGAEVHHFGPMGHDVGLVSFPDADLAAAARGLGVDGVVVRDLDDLEAVRAWAASGSGPLLVDAKVDPAVRAAWLDEAFHEADATEELEHA
jgi:thiamine pyrophosphate-dependent acetolactate synthase large subunit-like protein